jgi:O-acetyl-ADP-ribose deacetylase (regulator of RNase III)
MKIIFFDLYEEKIKEYKKVLDIVNNKNKKTEYSHAGNIKLDFLCSDLKELINLNKIDIIISPANSYGAMTGGIDVDICEIDPSIQHKVSARVKKSIYLDMDNSPYVPVGICEPIKINNNLTIVMAPTMKHPKDITKTNNVFLAFNAILICLQSLCCHHHNLIIACPCLGTGCGNMNVEDSARQILHAFLVHQIV